MIKFDIVYKTIAIIIKTSIKDNTKNKNYNIDILNILYYYRQ